MLFIYLNKYLTKPNLLVKFGKSIIKMYSLPCLTEQIKK